MSEREPPRDPVLGALEERAKELACLYRVDEILGRGDRSVGDVGREIVEALPPGWQYPDTCGAELVLEGSTFRTEGAPAAVSIQSAPILLGDREAGRISIFYTEERPEEVEGPFLREERKLLDTIADRISFFLMRREGAGPSPPGRWNVILDFLERTEPKLLVRITRRMINYLCWRGAEGSEALLQEFSPAAGETEARWLDENRPLERRQLRDLLDLKQRAFRLAADFCSEDEILGCLQGWIREDKSSFLLNALEDQGTSVSEILSALGRFDDLELEESELPQSMRTGLRVSLLSRFFSDDLEFINRAREHIGVSDVHELLQRTLFPPESRGKLGGKSAGLFVAAQMVKRAEEHRELLGAVRVPRTWYVTSDALVAFLRYNNMEDTYNWKYENIDAIRQQYPHLVQLFKNSLLPPEIRTGLRLALDDFEDRPIIVRSSSLLEDRVGAAFSGKHKSLFLGNQGSKAERLSALEDAIAEVYASIFSPDPIEYRAERGLLDVHEEMAVMIQEVVGARAGRYFLPAFSGVAFSRNEFRWSPRIRREDGLVRLVPGLGTRAVDRLSDDYPALLAPGQPGLRVNVTPDEVVRYSPHMVDLINLETNRFETVELRALLREVGSEYPAVRQLVSEVEGDSIRKPIGLGIDPERRDYVATFEGLIADTPFVTRIRALLGLLEERLQLPVDIEFASDGETLYLLQCRAQSYAGQSAPSPIPRNLDRKRVLFSAKRYVSNGFVPEITHLVYVDPESYASLPDAESMKEVGRAVGRLNSLLPKRRFILMGPGRWGSRGDIRLGVSVTYADINNTAVLVEIARRKGNYVPDLSFGTHFFQDLVEADIRYLPLYPDEEGILFNEPFLRRSRNILPELLPGFAHLGETVRVIDVVRQTEGRVLKVLLNADLDEAVGVLSRPEGNVAPPVELADSPELSSTEEAWRWRFRMAETIAASLDPGRFGVRALYLFGSTKNASAGPGSDIDLLVHFVGGEEQREDLEIWLEGWSLCLAELNYLRTGYRSEGLLDVHWVSDEDIRQGTSYAAKIDAITDPARPLALGGSATDGS